MNKPAASLALVATCGLGLEELLAGELAGLGTKAVTSEKGALRFAGDWRTVWRANYRLRTANRVLVELGSWPAADGEALARGAAELVRQGSDRWGGLSADDLFAPRLTFALRATTSASQVRDAQWAALKVKDGLVDGQRSRWGSRGSVERRQPDRAFRLLLQRDRATLLLDTSGEPLDRRGYRLATSSAPVREQLAAACVQASGWDGRGPVVDLMCGSGTLLVEAGWIALGRPPGFLRRQWAFENLPSFERAAFSAVLAEPVPALAPAVRLWGVEIDAATARGARANLDRAGLGERTTLRLGDAFEFEPPPGPGLVLVNPPHGERLASDPEGWRRLGDLLKKRYAGYRAVVLAGDAALGKQLGLKPQRRLPVWNGPLEARILVLDLFAGAAAPAGGRTAVTNREREPR